MLSPAQGVVAAMISPALLILASGSLIATALVRLARVVDRTHVLLGEIDAGTFDDLAAFEVVFDRHELRAVYAERAVAILFVAVIVFVADCLSIGVDHFTGDRLTWLPVSLAIAGMFMLIAGAAYMVAESRLGARQILEEIRHGRERLALRRAP
jgi:hypothetical protein